MKGFVYTTTNDYKFILPVQVVFKPLEDITTYELARLLPLMIPSRMLMPHEIPKEPELTRHLIINDPN